MKRKIIFTFFVVIVFCSMLLPGKSKPPAIPMKELTDPSSPSYVPYPYPKTEAEILDDLKYAIRYHFDSPYSRKLAEAYISKEVKKQSREHDCLVLGMLEKEPQLFVKEIIKVLDLNAKSSLHYYFFIILVNINQKAQCVAQLCDSGLLGGFMFIEQDKEFPAYLDQKSAANIFQAKLNNCFVQKIEYVYFDSSISNPFHPLWQMETDCGVFFIDYSGSLYKLKEESIPLGEGNIYDLSPEQKNEILLFDDMHDQVRFLRKIE